MKWHGNAICKICNLHINFSKINIIHNKFDIKNKIIFFLQVCVVCELDIRRGNCVSLKSRVSIHYTYTCYVCIHPHIYKARSKTSYRPKILIGKYLSFHKLKSKFLVQAHHELCRTYNKSNCSACFCRQEVKHLTALVTSQPEYNSLSWKCCKLSNSIEIDMWRLIMSTTLDCNTPRLSLHQR